MGLRHSRIGVAEHGACHRDVRDLDGVPMLLLFLNTDIWEWWGHDGGGMNSGHALAINFRLERPG